MIDSIESFSKPIDAIDLSASWMIGDSVRDMEAGEAAGCRTLLVSEEFTLKDAVEQIAVKDGFLCK